MEFTDREKQVLYTKILALSMKCLTKKETLEKMSKLSKKEQELLAQSTYKVVSYYVFEHADIFLKGYEFTQVNLIDKSRF